MHGEKRVMLAEELHVRVQRSREGNDWETLLWCLEQRRLQVRGCLPCWSGFYHCSLSFTSHACMEQSAGWKPSTSHLKEQGQDVKPHFHSWPAAQQGGGDAGGEQNDATSLHLNKNSQETH